MNRIYKVIWSKVKNCYIVVSEIAKSHSKPISTKLNSGKTVAAVLAVAALCAGMTTSVMAADQYYSVNDMNGAFSQFGNKNNDGAQGPGSVAAGAGAKVESASGSFQGAMATVVGSLNTVAAGTQQFDGVANSIVGTANATQNANATLIFGAGNAVSNSYADVSLNIGSINPADPVDTAKKLGAAVGESGGQVLVIGGANSVDYARFSAVTGVSNTLNGADGNTSDYNFITGAKNKLTNADSTYVIGSSNTVSDGTSNVVIGDKRNLTGATNDVVIGSADKEMETTVSDATILGHNANATTKDGVALGSNSVASVAAGVAGTVPTGTTVSDTDKASATWTSTLGAVSVGVPGTNAAATQTRQITGVAAGTQATDAVNVAQLNAVNTVVNANKTSISTLETTVNNNKTHFVHINQGTSGTNYNNDGAKGTNSIAIGKASTAGDNSIIIGQGAISKSGDATKYGNGSGDIAIGMGVKVNNYVNQGGGIAIGQNAQSENMVGQQEYYLALGQTTYSSGSSRNPDSSENMLTGVAIGKNTYARSGSTMIGTHSYVGEIGDTSVDTAKTISSSNNILSTTVGANSFNAGAMGSVVGAYSIISARNATQNFGATVMGSLNSVESSYAPSSYAGIANSIVGLGNRANNTNGTLIFGAGNEVTNSITNFDVPIGNSVTSAKDLQNRLIGTVRANNSGGSTLVMGGGNKADYTQLTSIMGVNNTVTGTSDDVSYYNYISGFNNTATNTDNVTVTGTNRTVTGANNTIVIGSADSTIETTTSDAVAVGRNTNVLHDSGVALGANSVSRTDKGVLGYDQSGKITSVSDISYDTAKYQELQNQIAEKQTSISSIQANMAELSEGMGIYEKWVANYETDPEYIKMKTQYDAYQSQIDEANTDISNIQTEIGGVLAPLNAWQSTDAAVSVGDVSKGITRQITGVAAGKEDTDAVNVAQLKAAKVEVVGSGDNVTVTSDNSEGYTKYTVAATDTKVTGLALDKNTLTLSQNGLADLTVTGIATTADLAANKVKYFSVKSELADNQNNDGAKDTNSIAIGPKAVAQRENGIALGTNVYSGGKGSIVIGSDSKVLENIALEGSIVIGKNATAFTGGGEQEAKLGFDPTNWPNKGSGGYDNPTDPTRVATSIVIGTNAFGRTGSIDIGDRVYRGTMGGIEITDENNNSSFHVNQTTLGTNSYNKGLFSTMVGAYSIATGGFDGSGRSNTFAYGAQNFGATVLGSLNSIRSNDDSSMYNMFAGVANTIVGVGNITEDSNGSLVFGAGNKVSNSVGVIVAPTDGADSVDSMVDQLQSAVRATNSGGSTLVIGGGNIANYTQGSSIIGVNNTLTGSSLEDFSTYNALTGYNNTANNVDNVTVTGINNTVSGSTSIVNLGNENAIEDSNNTILLGDNRTVSGSDNSVILGRANKETTTTFRAAADTTLTTTADNVVVMGYNANATVDDGVALGSNSVSSVDKGVDGYNPSTKELTGSTWTSTVGSVSVGDAANDITRQITGVAAGTADTDAVNVAQLKANKVTVAAGNDNVTVTPTTADDGATTYTVASKDIYTTKGTYDADSKKITFTQNDTEKNYEVDLSGLTDNIDKGLSFAGDSGDAINKQLGETINIVGGATDVTTDSNIGVASEDGKLNVRLAKDLTGLNSVKVGDAVTLGTTGLTITNGPSVTNTGINAGNQKITNVVAGVADTDAVNVSQLNANKIHYFHVNAAANGTNYNNNGASGTDAIAIGKSSTSGANSIAMGQSTTAANNSIAIGKVTISDSNGGKGSGDIAIGNGANINNYVDQGASIAIGQNAKIENMSGTQEYLFAMGQTTFHPGNFWGTIQIPDDPSKQATGIAIGENTYARTGSLMVGSHNYRGVMGDVTVDSADTKAQGVNINSTTLGTNSYNGGAFATITGAYSIASSNYNGGASGVLQAAKNFGATIMGSLNSVESATAGNSSGIANSVVGVANRTFNSNGSLIFGAGNEITNSITTINAPSSAGDSAKALQTTLMNSIKSSNSGGSTLAIGGGNKADYTQQSALIGVNNTLTGTSGNISQYNYITGFKNTGTNVDNVTIIGTNRTVSDAANSVVIGSADSAMTSSASDAVTIGRNANTTVNGGVALGSNSVASVAAEVAGYDPITTEASTETDATWKSTLAAVSVGVPTDGDAATSTRQITGVAAGMQDTDAVNVAQLKAAKVEVVAGKNISSVDSDTTEGYTKYTVNAIDTTITDGSAAYDADGTGTITLNTDANGTKGTVTVTGLTDKYVDDVTFADNTLTIKRNDDKTWAIGNIATKDDVSGSATHYYSVNDGNYQTTNYDNKGAKGGMSLAAGAGSTANGTASTVTGAFSRVDGDGTSGMTNGFQGATAAAYGSFNVIGAKSGVAFDGVANSIIGVANKTENANAALIMGAGNKVTNSYRPVNMSTAAPLANALQKAITTGDTDDMITALGGMVQTSGGAVLAIGGANTVDYALLSKVVGVGNTLTGTEGNESKLNMIDGFANTGTNVNNVTVIGSGNTVADTNSSIVLGDNRKLTGASNSVFLGAADKEMETTVADATAIGHNANVTVANGVALGSGSVANVDKDVAGYDVTTGKASTQTSATWKSTTAAVSVGDASKEITRQITGVAAGMQDTDAVNVAQLKQVADAATEAGKTTLNFTGDDTSEGATIARSNGQTLNIIGGAKATDADGNSLLTDNNIGVVKDGDSALKVQLAKNLTGLNSVAVGDAVKLGTTGLTITNGPSVTTTGIDAGSKVITNVANGVNPTDAVNVSQLNANKVTVAAGNDNVTVTPTTAENGTTYTVAAKDTYTESGTYDANSKKIKFVQNDTDKNYEVDVSGLVDGINENIDKGLNFAGDSGDAINKQLDQTLDIVGGAKGDLTTGNIGVVSEDGKLNVRLAKDLEDLNSVRIGGTTTDGKGIYIANQTVTSTKDGVDPEKGNYITGLDNKTWNPTADGYVSGRAATEDQLQSAISQVTTEVGGKHTAITLDKEAPTAGANGALGDYIGTGNLTMAVQEVDGQKVYDLKMSNNLVAGTPGADGKNGEAGSVTIIGKPGSAGADGKNASANIIVKDGSNGLDGKDGFTRVVYTDEDGTPHEVATLDDGLNFTGDTAGVTIAKKLNETLSITGGADMTKLSDNNIGVVAEEKGGLTVKLAKDLTMNDGSISFNNGVKLSSTGLDNGNQKITNVAAGTADTDAVNVSQLNSALKGAKHTEVTLNGDAPTAGADGALGSYIGTGNLTMAVKDVDGQKVYDLKMSKDLVAGTKPGADGKNGEAGSITIIGEAGKDGEDGTLGKNASANITVKDGKNGLDGTDGITRIVYKDEDGTDHEIATMDDGLNFTGDTAGVTVAKKLNETLSITGGITKADQLTTEDNIGVVASNSGLKVRLAKDLQDLNSVRIGGTTANGEGIYIANQTGVKTTTGKDEDDGLYITGLTNTTWNPKANGYVSGRAATEDQLNSVYETINSNIESSKAVSGKNITVDKDNKVNLNDEITLGDAASNNVAISGTNGTITAGDGGSNQVAIDGTKSTITAGTGDNKVTVDGNSGMVTVGDTTKDAISIGNQTVTPKVVGTDGTETDGTAKTGKYITGLENTTWNPTGEGYVADRAATEGQLKNVADNISKQISDIDTAVKSTSRVFESDSGADAQVTRKSTDPMKLKGGATGELSDGNIGVVNNSDKTGFDIKLSKDIKGLNSIEVNNKITIGTGDNQTIIEGDTINTGSVTTGNTTINNEGLTIVNEDSSKNITINNNNVNMGGNVIKNIGEGSEPTDAINKTQFDRAINNLGTGMNQINNRVNKLDNRVNRVGAGAAALAALHPLEFSPDAKWEVTAGVGNYRGANAIALGAFYRPNFDTMFSIGTSYGGGENMINAGVTWRIGEGETKAYPSKTVMAQEIDDLKTVVSEQQDQIEELKKLVNSLINK